MREKAVTVTEYDTGLKVLYDAAEHEPVSNPCMIE
jgi:hypothetical protein